MAFLIDKDEATAARRRVPFRLFMSDGTSPDTGASNGTVLWSVNGGAQLSAVSISAVSAAAGMYYAEFSQSNVSTLGSIAVYTDTIATDFPQHVATVQVVNFNPFSTQSQVLLGNTEYSAVTVRLGLVAYSGATVGAGNFAPGVYSGVSFSVRDSGIGNTAFQAGTYSNLTVQGAVNLDSSVSLRAVTHSGATVQGVTRIASTVTPADALYSAVTVRIDLQDYSGLTVGVGRIAPATYSGVTVGVTNPSASSSPAEIADAVWDETQAGHMLLGSYGMALRLTSIGSRVQSGSSSAVSLGSGETTTDDAYNNHMATFLWPDGFMASAVISDYTGASQSAQFLEVLPLAVTSSVSYILSPLPPSNRTLDSVATVFGIAPKTYSGVTVGINNIAAGNYSGATVGAGDIAGGTYSAVTVRIQGVSYSGLTIDGARFLSTAGERSVASSLLSTNMGSSRLFQEYLWPLRNRVQISGSTMTVYLPDDTSSAWTASVTTGVNALTGIDPSGP